MILRHYDEIAKPCNYPKYYLQLLIIHWVKGKEERQGWGSWHLLNSYSVGHVLDTSTCMLSFLICSTGSQEEPRGTMHIFIFFFFNRSSTCKLFIFFFHPPLANQILWLFPALWVTTTWVCCIVLMWLEGFLGGRWCCRIRF